MRNVNYTWPRRIHFIWNEDVFYLTLIAFGRRLHINFSRDGLSEEGLWN